MVSTYAGEGEKMVARVGNGRRPRLLLINPVIAEKAGINTSVFPLGLMTVAALTPEEFEIKVIDESRAKYRFEETDLVAMTSTTMSAPRAYEIAAQFRARSIPVIMGGIHASMMVDEALEHVDTVVVGEAEAIWPQVLADFRNGCLKRTYQGGFPDLKGLPITRQDKSDKKYFVGTIETSRGCPLNCSFCSVTTFNGGAYRRRPIEEVLDELERVRQKIVFFIDDNLVGTTPEHVEQLIELCKGIVRRRIRKWWFCQASVNFGENEELLKWAAKAGCKKVFIGFESIEKDQLLEINKRFNTRYDYDGIFRRINRHGIAAVGGFIYGFDGETLQSMRDRLDFILNNRINAPSLTMLTPMPGTAIYRRLEQENRLTCTHYPQDWARYTMNGLVFKLAQLDQGAFQRELYRHLKRLFSTHAILKRVGKTLIYTRSLPAAGFALIANVNYRANWGAFRRRQEACERMLQAPDAGVSADPGQASCGDHHSAIAPSGGPGPTLGQS